MPLVARGKYWRANRFVVVCRHRMSRTPQHQCVKDFLHLNSVGLICHILNHSLVWFVTPFRNWHSRQKRADRPGIIARP